MNPEWSIITLFMWIACIIQGLIVPTIDSCNEVHSILYGFHPRVVSLDLHMYSLKCWSCSQVLWWQWVYRSDWITNTASCISSLQPETRRMGRQCPAIVRISCKFCRVHSIGRATWPYHGTWPARRWASLSWLYDCHQEDLSDFHLLWVNAIPHRSKHRPHRLWSSWGECTALQTQDDNCWLVSVNHLRLFLPRMSASVLDLVMLYRVWIYLCS